MALLQLCIKFHDPGNSGGGVYVINVQNARLKRLSLRKACFAKRKARVNAYTLFFEKEIKQAFSSDCCWN
jgi:hypothetical protein